MSAAATPSSTKRRGKFKKGPRKNVGLGDGIPPTPSSSSNSKDQYSNDSAACGSLPVNLPVAQYKIIDDNVQEETSPLKKSYIRFIEKTPEELENEIEYDLDEEDFAFL